MGYPGSIGQSAIEFARSLAHGVGVRAVVLPRMDFVRLGPAAPNAKPVLFRRLAPLVQRGGFSGVTEVPCNSFPVPFIESSGGATEEVSRRVSLQSRQPG